MSDKRVSYIHTLCADMQWTTTHLAALEGSDVDVCFKSQDSGSATTQVLHLGLARGGLDNTHLDRCMDNT